MLEIIEVNVFDPADRHLANLGRFTLLVAGILCAKNVRTDEEGRSRNARRYPSIDGLPHVPDTQASRKPR